MFILRRKKLITTFVLMIMMLVGASIISAQKPKKSTSATKKPAVASPDREDAEVVPVKTKKIAATRIGIVTPKANLADVPGTTASEAVQNTFYELVKSKTVDVVAIESRLPIQVMPEAEEKDISYILYTTLTQKKGSSGGGFLGKMAGRVSNKIAGRVPGGGGIGAEVAKETAVEALQTASTLAVKVKVKDEMTLEYKLVKVDGSQVILSNSITTKAKANGEDIITAMIETAANDILTNVGSSAGSGNVGKSAPSVPTATVPRAVAANTGALIPFIKVMNESFAPDYVGETIRTKVRFVASGQAKNWVFGTIPAKVMAGKMAFRVFDEATGSSTDSIGSTLPHIFIDKENADLVFALKKGDSLILTGAPFVGTQSTPGGPKFTEIIFVATSIEKVK